MAAAGGGLPARLAAGPDPRRWPSEWAWRAAAEMWSRRAGLGAVGWLDLLPLDVRYWVSALGRAHRRVGLRAPWDR